MIELSIANLGRTVVVNDFGTRGRLVGYSEDGQCLPSHPVAIPQLDLAVRYPPLPAHEVAELSLASGDLTTVHADFWNLWDEAKLRREVDVCIRGDVVCTLGPG